MAAGRGVTLLRRGELLRATPAGWLLGALAGLGVLCFGARSHAEPALAGLELSFHVPAGCPSRESFIEAVRERISARVRGDLGVRVELVGDAEHSVGTLTLKLPDGQEAERDIPEAPCSGALASMAVITAMVWEGAGLDVPPPAASEEGAPPPIAQNQPQREPAATPRVAAAPARRSAPSSLRVAGVAAIGLSSGVTPSWVGQASLGLALGTAARPAPSVRLLALVTPETDTHTPLGDAAFRLLALGAVGCVGRWPAPPSAGLSPCLSLEVGQLRGRGTRTEQGRSQFMVWASLGPALRFDLPLNDWTALELELRAARLLRDDRFVFEPGLVAHDVPEYVAGFRFGLRLGR